MKYFTLPIVTIAMLCSTALAQEPTPTPVPTCSDADKAALNACVAACEAQVPQCQKSIIDLVALREKIAEKCKCDKARNYGQYRSCVNSVINPMRSFALLDAAAKAAIAADNAACKKTIADRKNNKGNHGNNGKNK